MQSSFRRAIKLDPTSVKRSFSTLTKQSQTRKHHPVDTSNNRLPLEGEDSHGDTTKQGQ
jgi:hypothetical protein